MVSETPSPCGYDSGRHNWVWHASLLVSTAPVVGICADCGGINWEDLAAAFDDRCKTAVALATSAPEPAPTDRAWLQMESSRGTGRLLAWIRRGMDR